MDAKQMGFYVEALYVFITLPEIVSGKKNVTGRKLGRLITRMNKDDTLIVSEISRLSRILTDIMTIMGKSLERGSGPKESGGKNTWKAKGIYS